MAKVKATKRGFHHVERLPGEVFDGPVDAKGELLKASWFKPAPEEDAKAKAKADRDAREAAERAEKTKVKPGKESPDLTKMA